MVCDTLAENIIKGIVVKYNANGGATLEDIKHDYYKCVGEDLLPGRDDSHAEKYLHGISHLHSEKQANGSTVWLINLKRNYVDTNVISSNQVVSTNKPNMIRKPPRANEIVVCERPIHSSNDDHRTQSSSAPESTESNTCKRQVNRPSNSTNNSSSTAMLNGYHMVGDDFFLTIATIELGFQFTKKGRIRQCGLCVSGQSIRAATKRLQTTPNLDNSKVIINVGSIDILHGNDLVDMRYDYQELLNVCASRNIKAILTTLPPLANRNHAPDDVKKINLFNKFLLNTFSASHRVVDIKSCMVRRNGSTAFHCYQQLPKYVSGSNQPHVLWNRIGRERILKMIKKQAVN